MPSTKSATSGSSPRVVKKDSQQNEKTYEEIQEELSLRDIAQSKYNIVDIASLNSLVKDVFREVSGSGNINEARRRDLLGKLAVEKYGREVNLSERVKNVQKSIEGESSSRASLIQSASQIAAIAAGGQFIAPAESKALSATNSQRPEIAQRDIQENEGFAIVKFLRGAYDYISGASSAVSVREEDKRDVAAKPVVVTKDIERRGGIESEINKIKDSLASKIAEAQRALDELKTLHDNGFDWQNQYEVELNKFNAFKDNIDRDQSNTNISALKAALRADGVVFSGNSVISININNDILGAIMRINDALKDTTVAASTATATTTQQVSATEETDTKPATQASSTSGPINSETAQDSSTITATSTSSSQQSSTGSTSKPDEASSAVSSQATDGLASSATNAATSPTVGATTDTQAQDTATETRAAELTTPADVGTTTGATSANTPEASSAATQTEASSAATSSPFTSSEAKSSAIDTTTFVDSSTQATSTSKAGTQYVDTTTEAASASESGGLDDSQSGVEPDSTTTAATSNSSSTTASPETTQAAQPTAQVTTAAAELTTPAGAGTTTGATTEAESTTSKTTALASSESTQATQTNTQPTATNTQATAATNSPFTSSEAKSSAIDTTTFVDSSTQATSTSKAATQYVDTTTEAASASDSGESGELESGDSQSGDSQSGDSQSGGEPDSTITTTTSNPGSATESTATKTTTALASPESTQAPQTNTQSTTTNTQATPLTPEQEEQDKSESNSTGSTATIAGVVGGVAGAAAVAVAVARARKKRKEGSHTFEYISANDGREQPSFFQAMRDIKTDEESGYIDIAGDASTEQGNPGDTPPSPTTASQEVSGVAANGIILAGEQPGPETDVDDLEYDDTIPANSSKDPTSSDAANRRGSALSTTSRRGSGLSRKERPNDRMALLGSARSSSVDDHGPSADQPPSKAPSSTTEMRPTNIPLANLGNQNIHVTEI